MPKISVKVPSGTCIGCRFLETKIIDHNYYGEKTKKKRCRIFDERIYEHVPCTECSSSLQKEGTFSLEEVNAVGKEMYERGFSCAVKTLQEKLKDVRCD